MTKAGCPHCAKFEQLFLELAAELGSETAKTAETGGDQFAPLAFGTVDAVYNDLPGALMARVERFPTLLWLPLTAEQPVVVPDEQSPAAVRAFVQAQRTKAGEVGGVAARAVPLWSTLPTGLAALAGDGEAAAKAMRGEVRFLLENLSFLIEEHSFPIEEHSFLYKLEAEAKAAFEELDRKVIFCWEMMDFLLGNAGK